MAVYALQYADMVIHITRYPPLSLRSCGRLAKDEQQATVWYRKSAERRIKQCQEATFLDV